MNAVVLLLALILPCAALAQGDPGATARRAAAALDQAANELAEARGAHNRVAALTDAIRAYESGLGALREGRRRAAMREASIQAAFDAESGHLSQLIGALQTIHGAPEASLLLHPAGPIGTARSGMIMADVTPALQSEVGKLRARLQEIAELREVQEEAETLLRQGLGELQSARAELSQAVAERGDLPVRVTEDPEQLDRLLTSTETLQGFAEGLGRLSPGEGATPLPDFAAAKGDLALPVRGSLLRKFNEADAAGVPRPGWLLATQPGALVTTPWPATIRYRGPLLDYGNVMILEPSEGYLMVFAGLSDVYGDAGEVLPEGAPVGLVGDGGGAAMPRGIDEGADKDRIDTLYIEVRQDGDAVDPAKWFRRTED